MMRTEAVARVQEGLGFTTTQSTFIIKRMQEEQRDLERGKTLPKFLMKEDQTLLLTVGNPNVALPSDYLRRTNMLPRYIPTGTVISQTIPWKEFDVAYAAHDSSTPSGPKALVMRNTSIRVLPNPDKAYTIFWTYYQKDQVLNADVENLWLKNAPELIIGGAGLRLAKDKRDNSAIQFFADMYKQARMSWLGETVTDELDDDTLILGANA